MSNLFNRYTVPGTAKEMPIKKRKVESFSFSKLNVSTPKPKAPSPARELCSSLLLSRFNQLQIETKRDVEFLQNSLKKTCADYDTSITNLVTVIIIKNLLLPLF